jgi:hypothetical protein
MDETIPIDKRTELERLKFSVETVNRCFQVTSSFFSIHQLYNVHTGDRLSLSEQIKSHLVKNSSEAPLHHYRKLPTLSASEVIERIEKILQTRRMAYICLMVFNYRNVYVASHCLLIFRIQDGGVEKDIITDSYEDYRPLQMREYIPSQLTELLEDIRVEKWNTLCAGDSTPEQWRKNYLDHTPMEKTYVMEIMLN